MQKSDLTKSDLAALGQEEPQICWEEEIALPKTDDVKDQDIPVSETAPEGETEAVVGKKQPNEEEKAEKEVEAERKENIKDEEAAPPKPEDGDVKASGTSAVLYAAFYEEWTSNTGKVFFIYHHFYYQGSGKHSYWVN